MRANLGRHRSTIYREVRRNYSHLPDYNISGYYHIAANHAAQDRIKSRCKLHKVTDLKEFIIAKLKLHWSPEQIAGYLKSTKSKIYACAETIYRFIYSQEGKNLGLYYLLFKGRKNRRKRYARKPRGMNIPSSLSIHKRPESINSKKYFGHWEGDLVIFKKDLGKRNITTLVERKTRFTIITKNENKTTNVVMQGIASKLSKLPRRARKSLTLDRGTEFSGYKSLKKRCGITSYFCDPSSPWQKGAIEHFNARLRKFLPRDKDLALLNDNDLIRINNAINSIPRKCLGYKTPIQAFKNELENI